MTVTHMMSETPSAVHLTREKQPLRRAADISGMPFNYDFQVIMNMIYGVATWGIKSASVERSADEKRSISFQCSGIL